MPETWSYTGDWITSCNCDWGCPCNFNARPTPGHCEGIVAAKIRDGKYGKISLKGLSIVAAAWWPGAIHEGNGVAQLYIDDKASKEQENAIVSIVTGQAGGMPWSIFSKTFKTLLPPKRAPIEFKVQGKDTTLKVGSAVNIASEPMKNPVTGADHFADVVMQTFLIFPKGSLFSNKVHTVKEPAHERLNWSHPGKYIAVAGVDHRGP